jgi:hypothetical protein
MLPDYLAYLQTSGRNTVLGINELYKNERAPDRKHRYRDFKMGGAALQMSD